MEFKRVAVPQLPKGSQTDQETGCSSSVEIDREMRMLHSGGGKSRHTDRLPVGWDQKVLRDSGIISNGTKGGALTHTRSLHAMIGAARGRDGEGDWGNSESMLRSRPLITG